MTHYIITHTEKDLAKVRRHSLMAGQIADKDTEVACFTCNSMRASPCVHTSDVWQEWLGARREAAKIKAEKRTRERARRAAAKALTERRFSEARKKQS